MAKPFLFWVEELHLIVAANHLISITGACGDTWDDAELAYILSYLASVNPAYGLIPLGALRRKFVALRKAGKLKSLRNKRTADSDDQKEFAFMSGADE